MNWPQNAALRARMLVSAARARAPVMFIQAENDFDIGPTRELWAEMTRLGKPCRMHIYPPFGTSNEDGHRFIVGGMETWSDDVDRFLKEVFSGAMLK